MSTLELKTRKTRPRQRPRKTRNLFKLFRGLCLGRVFRVLSMWVLIITLAPPARTQQPGPVEGTWQIGQIRALPLYQPCSELRSDQEEVPAAIQGLKDKRPPARIGAAERLARSCDSRAIEPLIGLLGDEEVMVRVAAVEALARLGDRRALEPLIDVLADPDWRVRACLGRALCSFQVSRSSYAALNRLVNSDGEESAAEGDWRARCLGILAINQLRDVRFSRKAVIFLFGFLDHRDERFRRIAEETAMEMKNTRNGYHELIAILKQHTYPVFRRKAAYWLGRFELEEARPALTEASITDSDPEVRRIALAALKNR